MDICRIWSVRRGEQLFQINFPGPVTHIHLDAESNIYCSCLKRLTVFKIEALFKDGDLPTYWQTTAMHQMVSQLILQQNNGFKPVEEEFIGFHYFKLRNINSRYSKLIW